jgi:hypothetical protein
MKAARWCPLAHNSSVTIQKQTLISEYANNSLKPNQKKAKVNNPRKQRLAIAKPVSAFKNLPCLAGRSILPLNPADYP